MPISKILRISLLVVVVFSVFAFLLFFFIFKDSFFYFSNEFSNGNLTQEYDVLITDEDRGSVFKSFVNQDYLCKEGKATGKDGQVWVPVITDIISLYENEGVNSVDILDEEYFDEVSKIKDLDIRSGKVNVVIMASKTFNSGIDSDFDQDRSINFSCSFKQSFFISDPDRDKKIMGCIGDRSVEDSKVLLGCIQDDGYIAYKLCRDSGGSLVMSDCIFVYDIP